jgi:excinuclease UvrABC ATPase subunit
MEKNIVITGINTNNLKNINVSLVKNGINLIIGPSGSGKSSLAYDTIAKIGQHELSSMYSDISTEPDYKVNSYSNMLVTIPIKQNNNNNNIHSTIGTYFNMNPHIALLYSAVTNIPYDYFILNKPENVCPQCHGIGYTKELDVNRVIDYNISLENCPVKCWSRHKDFYKQIIKEFCRDNDIDFTKTFRTLSKRECELFLYGESKKKYQIRYKHSNLLSQRTTPYYGILSGKPMLHDFNPSMQFYAEKECSLCKGRKFNQEHQAIKLNTLSIGELMCTKFIEINKWIKTFDNKKTGKQLDFVIKEVASFADKAINLNLGYLYFNRTIPSLSGGELQRLRLVQVFNTQLSNLLIVLDEPLSGLSGEEKKSVYENIKKLSMCHTLLIVDHHNLFFKDSANIIALGKKSGKFGGNIIDSREYIAYQMMKHDFSPLQINNTLLSHIKVDNHVYDFVGIDINIAQERMNLISGKSGVGKSTLLREYFSQYFENYSYINQKVLLGKSDSIVATLLDIMSLIAEDFSRVSGKERNCFSNFSGSIGTCQTCSGIGYVTYGSDFQDKITMLCKDCGGTGFNKKLKQYTIENQNIFDVIKMTVEEAYDFYKERSEKISAVLLNAKQVLLGHLLIGQRAATLSGGENIRIKLLKSIKEKTSVYGIDEPFRGLNNSEIYTITLFLNKFIEKKKTVIVVDHEEESFKYFSNHITLINDKRRLIGK